MLASRFHTRCRMLALVLTDGTKLAWTDHDVDLTYNLLKDGVGSLTYVAGEGIVTSDISLSCSLDASNMEVRGPIGTNVSLDDLLGGRYDEAVAYIFEVNHTDLTLGEIAFMKGEVSEVRVEGGEFVFEVRDQKAKYSRHVGKLITNQCPWDFADGFRCNVVPTLVTGTVTAAVSPMEFTVSYAGSYADAFFNKGRVLALTGVLAGTLPVEIESWTAAGVIKLFAPLIVTPEIGATFEIKNGCSKLRKHTDPAIPTCLTHGNVIEFGGYPEVPGSDKILRAQVPKSGGGGGKK